MTEEWRPVSKYDGYEVSNHGKVRNVRTREILLPRREYRYVEFYYDGKKKLRKLARVIAKAWLPNEDNLPHVIHIDGDPRNNHVSNLKWSTFPDRHYQKFKDVIAELKKEEEQPISWYVERKLIVDDKNIRRYRVSYYVDGQHKRKDFQYRRKPEEAAKNAIAWYLEHNM